jgi:hypothetical protein
MLGCDWWANLWVNGKLVETQRNPEERLEDGAFFTRWKPIPADVELKKGENVFLVKCHQGSCANWFTFRISDPGDLKLVPKSQAADSQQKTTAGEQVKKHSKTKHSLEFTLQRATSGVACSRKVETRVDFELRRSAINPTEIYLI